MGQVLIDMRPAFVKDRAGEELAETHVRVWRETNSRATVGGQAYDYKGVCDGDAAEHLVGKQNRVIEVGTESYNVVDAMVWNSLGYVELFLRQVKNDG